MVEELALHGDYLDSRDELSAFRLTCKHAFHPGILPSGGGFRHSWIDTT